MAMNASNAKLLCSARMVSVSAPKIPVEATVRRYVSFLL